jgi:CHASE2 domain-containing sensor protein
MILVTLILLAGERMSSLESSYYDFLQRQQPVSASDQILLVDTGPDSGGGNLWDSGRISPVINALNAAGASVIVPVEAPPANTRMPDIEQLAALAELEERARKVSGNDTGTGTNLADQLANFRRQYDQRAQITSTVKDAGNVVLPVVARPTRQGLEDAKNDCLRHTLPTDAAAGSPWIQEAPGTLTLSNLLCDSATNAGFLDFWPDNDGIVRRTHLVAKSDTRVFPALSVAIAQAQERGDVEIDG